MPQPAIPAPPPALPYGWLFLLGLAVIFGLLNPIMIAFQPRPDLTAGLLVAAGIVLAVGWLRRWPPATAVGAALLWAGVVAGTMTQTAPLGVAPGLVWGPRGLLLLAAALGWLLFVRPPGWIMRGLLAAAVPTAMMLGLLWVTAPPVPRTAIFYWVAVDSQGTVYANDADKGFLWVFDAGGGVRGKLWPRQVAPGTPGPGLQPAGLGRELTGVLPTATPLPGGRGEAEFSFCGLAVDPQDHLYVLDPTLAQVRQFHRDAQLRAAWPLPPGYTTPRGCLAADRDRVYVADSRGTIDLYSHEGVLQTQWARPRDTLGMAVAQDGQLLVLEQTQVVALAAPDGREVRTWPLPAPNALTQGPYLSLAVRNGEVLITDLGANLVRRYSADGQALAPWGGPGGWPGQFALLGGLATDKQGRVYAVDTAYRVVQRFRPDGIVDAVWSAPEDEAGE